MRRIAPPMQLSGRAMQSIADQLPAHVCTFMHVHARACGEHRHCIGHHRPAMASNSDEWAAHGGTWRIMAEFEQQHAS